LLNAHELWFARASMRLLQRRACPNRRQPSHERQCSRTLVATKPPHVIFAEQQPHIPDDIVDRSVIDVLLLRGVTNDASERWLEAAHEFTPRLLIAREHESQQCGFVEP
jgi:hypothetical protein